ncbi:MAG: protein jag [Clostridia bacterium]|nr:protein jag [Clostridia bacterium]
MEKTIIAEGKTTNEAIENGLKELNVPRNLVNVKVLENEDKRSFFSILTPRIVKVEMTIKDTNKVEIQPKKETILNQQEKEKATQNIEKFLKEFMTKLPEGTSYQIETTQTHVMVNITNKNLGYLIGYRGETLYALQNILSSIASKGIENRIRVILDIEGYKAKREKTLEDLAEKVAKTVIRTKKSIKLEPMQAYERKVIHSKLQQNPKIETTSVGEEPHRRIIVSLKK